MESSAPATKPTLTTRPSPSFRLRTSSLNSLRLRRVFDLFDHNGDGQITIPEICSALDRLGLSADPSELASVVSAYIRPGRQGLDFDDFHNLHSALGDALFGPDDGGQPESEAESEEERDMAEAFKVFDEDGDGFISAKELQAVLGKLGLPEGRSIGRVEEMIGSVDRNHDGRVDFPEFKSMMRSVAVQSA